MPMTDDELDQRVRAAILSNEVDTSRLELVLRNQLRNQIQPDRYVPRWAAVAAGIIAMVLASILSYRTFVKERNTPQLCIAAARDHQTEIVNGESREWLTDLPAIQSLGEKQGVPASALAALATTGYRLERGRLCFLKKQIYLHLVYTKDGDELSVYLRPRGSELFDSSVREASVGSEHLAYFQTGRLTAVTVANHGALGFAVKQRFVLQ
jgi:hypothetical protein